jgi:hypothetical protein
VTPMCSQLTYEGLLDEENHRMAMNLHRYVGLIKGLKN